MCGRFTEITAFDVLAERFGITVEAGTRSPGSKAATD